MATWEAVERTGDFDPKEAEQRLDVIFPKQRAESVDIEDEPYFPSAAELVARTTRIKKNTRGWDGLDVDFVAQACVRSVTALR